MVLSPCVLKKTHLLLSVVAPPITVSPNDGNTTLPIKRQVFASSSITTIQWPEAGTLTLPT
jgi:hypothetical protein